MLLSSQKLNSNVGCGMLKVELKFLIERKMPIHGDIWSMF